MRISRRRKRTAAALLQRGKRLLEIASSPDCPHDPAWLKRRTEAMIRYAERRQDNRIRKIEDIRKSRRKKSTH